MGSRGITKARVENTQTDCSNGVWDKNWTSTNKLILHFPAEMAINISLLQIRHRNKIKATTTLKADLEKECGELSLVMTAWVKWHCTGSSNDNRAPSLRDSTLTWLTASSKAQDGVPSVNLLTLYILHHHMSPSNWGLWTAGRKKECLEPYVVI